MAGRTNEINLRRLVCAIDALSEHDWFDYLAVAAPLLLSVVAIWISISTARKQNRIALFEFRYTALFQLKTILDFDVAIQGKIEHNTIIFLFDSYFDTDLSNCDVAQAYKDIVSTGQRLEKTTLIKTLVNKPNEAIEIRNIISVLQELMFIVVDEEINEPYETCRNRLHELCNAFSDGTYQKLRKRTRI